MALSIKLALRQGQTMVLTPQLLQAIKLLQMPNLELVLHAADQWASDDAALEKCRADIGSGDIVIATMLFLEDHIRAVLPALQARRDNCDAMLCCMAAAEVTKLTRIGQFDMSREATGAMALL